jgi:hypothetical protein
MLRFFREKWSKKVQKGGKLLVLLLVCDLPFPPSLSFIDCGTNMWVVLCCQDHILPSHTLPTYDLPCHAFTFRYFVPCLVEDSYRRTAEADSYFPLVETNLFLPVKNPI